MQPLHRRHKLLKQDALSSLGLGGLNDVDLGTLADNDILQYDTGAAKWANVTLAAAGISAVGHTHVEADITDLGNYSVVGHTHVEADIADGSILARLADTETITGAWTFTNTAGVVIGDGDSADNEVLLKFNIDRAWQFEVNGEGAGTALALRALTSDKQFHIQDSLSVTQFYFDVGATPEFRQYDGGGTDYLAEAHGGTDFNSTFVNTADWNVSGNSRYNWVDSSHRHLVMGVTGGANPADCATIDMMEYTSGQVDWGAAAGYGARIKYDASANLFLLYTGNQATQYEHIRMPRDNTRVHLCGDTIGYFEAVSGNYGSVQVSGAEGSSGGYSGFSIAGRLVFMENGSGTGGIYDDVNNDWRIRTDLNNAGVGLYHNSTETFRTVSAASGGAQANNTSTGAGWERVLTTSDLGGGGLDTKVKTATTSRASTTTFADDPHLSGWSLTTGKRYAIIGHITYTASNTTPDIKFDWQFSNTPADGGDWGLLASDDAGVLQEADSESPITTAMTALQIASREQAAWIHGHFRANATTGGTLDLQWAQNTSSATSTQILDGSWVALIQLD